MSKKWKLLTSPPKPKAERERARERRERKRIQGVEGKYHRIKSYVSPQRFISKHDEKGGFRRLVLQFFILIKNKVKKSKGNVSLSLSLSPFTSVFTPVIYNHISTRIMNP